MYLSVFHRLSTVILQRRSKNFSLGCYAVKTKDETFANGLVWKASSRERPKRDEFAGNLSTTDYGQSKRIRIKIQPIFTVVLHSMSGVIRRGVTILLHWVVPIRAFLWIGQRI